MQTPYTLKVELDPTTSNNLAVTLYAADNKGNETGLMNCNKIAEYIEESLIAEDSSDPLVLTQHEAKWLIFSILKDWDSWNNFLVQDLEGQDLI